MQAELAQIALDASYEVLGIPCALARAGDVPVEVRAKLHNGDRDLKLAGLDVRAEGKGFGLRVSEVADSPKSARIAFQWPAPDIDDVEAWHEIRTADRRDAARLEWTCKAK